MKKIILILVIILSATSCRIFKIDPFEPTYATCRYIKNNTGEELIVMTRDWISGQSLSQGDSISVFLFNPPKKWGVPTFDTNYEWQNENGNGQKQFLSISSADGKLLKKWIYGGTDMPEERFFKEASWRFFTKEGTECNLANDEVFIWVFDILPEDIAPGVEAEL